MNRKNSFFAGIMKLASYILVAAVASGITFWLCLGIGPAGGSKLEQLQSLIEERFVDIKDVDMTKVEDAAAAAMVEALGDRWSYYIPASEFQALMDQKANEYVGVGITISPRTDNTGFDILKVEPGGGAQEAGILPGDILIAIEDKSVVQMGTDGSRALIQGTEGTKVSVTVLRDGQEMKFTLTRKRIKVTVAEGKLLDGNIGYITIKNFDDRCATETKAMIEKLIGEGATSLIFDVRNNPGGYKHELVALLDYLLPKGEVFRSMSYTGQSEVDYSDDNCLRMPMAVLVNSESYSAAEFFAAALEEYDWAIVAGDPTCGKGHYQNTFQFTDGSGVGLSTGKYFTPKGVCLEDVGGLVPEVLVEVDLETAAKIYAGLIEAEEDPQVQAAVAALKG